MKLNRTNALAAFWGIAEATVFFIVPDVLLSWVALRDFKKALWACVWALAGALLGGALIWFIAHSNPDALGTLFTSLPAIDDTILGNARSQLDNRGLVALFVGPLIGTPYKIYALQAAFLAMVCFQVHTSPSMRC